MMVSQKREKLLLTEKDDLGKRLDICNADRASLVTELAMSVRQVSALRKQLDSGSMIAELAASDRAATEMRKQLDEAVSNLHDARAETRSIRDHAHTQHGRMHEQERTLQDSLVQAQTKLAKLEIQQQQQQQQWALLPKPWACSARQMHYPSPPKHCSSHRSRTSSIVERR
jgi:chromosome segregation ATPase